MLLLPFSERDRRQIEEERIREREREKESGLSNTETSANTEGASIPHLAPEMIVIVPTQL